MLFPYRRRRFGGDNGLPAGAALFLTCALATLLRTGVAHAGELETLRVENLPMSRVIVRGAVEVEIRQGEPAELLMRGPAEQLALRPFIAREKLLVLGDSEQAPRTAVSDVRYKLTLPTLEMLQLAGSGTVYVRNLKAGDLDVRVDGSGDARLFAIDGKDVALAVNGLGDLELVQLRARDLNIVVAGSGDMRFEHVTAERRVEAVVKGSGDIVSNGEGRADAMKLAIVGSGDIDLRGVQATTVEVNIVGSGNARVGSVQGLDVTVLGSGDVYYRGEPEISTTILGSGRLHDGDD